MRIPDSRPHIATLVALALILAWDASGADLPLARLFGTPAGFAWRDSVWLTTVLHSGGKNASWALLIGLALAARWPVGLLRRLTRAERWQIVVAALASVGAVTLLKRASHTSCPWDTQAFGGVASYVSHWAWGLRDGGPGRCFPAGHASAAFAFVGGWFVLRRHTPSAARVWLVGTLIAGLIFGIGQQMRGAHYMSHTLWSGWVCWLVGWGADATARALGARRRASQPADVPLTRPS